MLQMCASQVSNGHVHYTTLPYVNPFQFAHVMLILQKPLIALQYTFDSDDYVYISVLFHTKISLTGAKVACNGSLYMQIIAIKGAKF